MIFEQGRVYQVNNPRAKLFGRYVKTVNVVDVPDGTPLLLGVIPVGKDYNAQAEPQVILPMEVRPATLEELVNEFVYKNKAELPMAVAYSDTEAGVGTIEVMPNEHQLRTFTPGYVTTLIEQWGMIVDDVRHDVDDDIVIVAFKVRIP